MKLKKIAILSILGALLVSGAGLAAADKGSDSLPSLDSANPVEQVAACRLLGAKGDKDSVPDLISLLESTSNTDVAAAAAAALGAIGKKEGAVEALLRVAEKSESNRVLYASLAALANLRDSDNAEAIDAVITRAAENAGDELVQDLAQKLQARFSK